MSMHSWANRSSSVFAQILAKANSPKALHRGYHATLPLGSRSLTFGTTKEEVFQRSEYPKPKLEEILDKKTISILGYGPQGRGQSLNLKDTLPNTKILIGLRKSGSSWEKAKLDGWEEDSSLFEIEEACQKGDIIINLLSDAAQKQTWDRVSKYLTKGKILCFSHGFSIVYKDLTNVVPPKDVDVILVAPKGSGTTVRSLFTEGKGINSSIGVHQDYSGKAYEYAKAIGFSIGSGYLFPTTFRKEVYSDLSGERGVLMGGIYGLFRAQYDVLRKNGHSPSEAFNESVEEATQSLIPLIGKNGMDWMFANCSTTAQRGALDWYAKFYDAVKPVMENIYEEVKNGNEAKRSIEENSRADYRERLNAELKEIEESEMWQSGKVVRSLRPENQNKV